MVGAVCVHDAEISLSRFAITQQNGDNSSETNVTDKYYSGSHLLFTSVIAGHSR